MAAVNELCKLTDSPMIRHVSTALSLVQYGRFSLLGDVSTSLRKAQGISGINQ